MKGSLLDLPVMLALLLAAGITIYLSYYVLSAISAAWPVPGDSQTVLDDTVTTFQVFDQMFVFFAVGLGAFVIISGFYIQTHPVFFFFGAIILIPVVVMTSAQISNAFYSFAITPEISTVTTQFPLTYTFIMNLPLFMLVIGVFVAIVMYGKPGGEI